MSKQRKRIIMFIEYKKYEIWHEKLLIWTHFLLNSNWVSWNITVSVQKFKWHWMNPWLFLKIKYWILLTQRPLFSFTSQYNTFNIFRHISHFETVTILLSLWLLILSFAFEFWQYCKLWEPQKIGLAIWRHF